MTLVFAYGTSAELIKYSPVLYMLRNYKDVQLWSTSQQGASVLVFEDKYGIESVTRLSNKPEKSLEKRSQVPAAHAAFPSAEPQTPGPLQTGGNPRGAICVQSGPSCKVAPSIE